MLRLAAIAYSLSCYVIGLVAIAYFFLFVGDLIVPVTINRNPFQQEIWPPLPAAAWNIALITLWGAQHSLMARPGFKAIWTRFVPPPVERSTYVLVVALLSFALFWLWRPMPMAIWDLSGTAWASVILGVYVLGWVIVLITTFLLSHFGLMGVEQAYRFARRIAAPTERFRTPLFYKLVRHPMMTGFLIAFWAAPILSAGRLLFNVAMTIYILVGVYLEEKTLTAELGDEYERYRKSTPKLIPGVAGTRAWALNRKISTGPVR